MISQLNGEQDKILAIHGVNFTWNEKAPSPGRKDIGVIAQDVEKQFPTTVIDNKGTGYKMVDYAALVAPLIEAVRELSHKILGNEEKIGALEAKVEKLESENQALKSYLCAKDPSAPFCATALTH